MSKEIQQFLEMVKQASVSVGKAEDRPYYYQNCCGKPSITTLAGQATGRNISVFVALSGRSLYDHLHRNSG